MGTSIVASPHNLGYNPQKHNKTMVLYPITTGTECFHQSTCGDFKKRQYGWYCTSTLTLPKYLGDTGTTVATTYQHNVNEAEHSEELGVP